DRLNLSRRYSMWRILSPLRLLVTPRYAAAVARWLEYRRNLFDGVEGRSEGEDLQTDHGRGTADRAGGVSRAGEGPARQGGAPRRARRAREGGGPPGLRARRALTPAGLPRDAGGGGGAGQEHTHRRLLRERDALAARRP